MCKWILFYISIYVIVVPPSDPFIMDEHGQRVNGIIGPYDEGSRVTLFCDADGGKFCNEK